MIPSLSQACAPRQSVFDPSIRDTVYSIDDLNSIDPGAFFEENYVTQGMRQLLTEAFGRLEGRSQNAPGAFLLSQSMGGGKTHNLLALGLLAKYPSNRAKVMGDFYQQGNLGQVRVVTFSGRKTNVPYGVWGEIAQQLGKQAVFQDFYAPLAPPGNVDWVELLKGEPVLLLLDELPPYFQAARAKEVGATTLDVITTTAIANLLDAVASGKLPNACVVLTDLSGTAYSLGGESLSSALKDLENEANRSVQRIDPVRLNSDEFYSILRTRLFEKLPDQETVAVIADAFQAALGDAVRLDLTSHSPQQLRADITSSYPFHPGLRDLYARFRENQGFQQTRALIRLMRIVVAQLWKESDASSRYVIGAHDIDLHDADVMNEIRQINRTLENAIAHDIADEQGNSVAEQIDAGGKTDAQDVARLIFISSLSTAVNPTLGLTRSDIVRALAAPGRDLSGITKAADRLQNDAWYIHATHTGNLLFKNVENLNAKLESYAKGATREAREVELRARLAEMFKAVVGSCYQEVKALPPLDQVTLTAEKTTLVIVRPDVQAQTDIERFYSAQTYKNRVLFLTTREAEYQPVLQRLAYLRGIDAIISEFKQQGMRESDSQFKDALDIKTKNESNFYVACREAFHTIWYPSSRGLTELELDPKYVANQYEGERQITEALFEVHKFRPDASVDTGLKSALESRLWPQGSNEASWTEIKRRAAQEPGWIWHHPKALDDLKERLINQGQWRDLTNGFVQRGPFPAPKTSVSVQVLSRDPETGRTRLRITPLHASQVRIAEGGDASVASPLLDASKGWEIETDKPSLSFLGEDTSGEHEPGEPVVWINTIEVKHRFYQDGDARRCELKAIPSGDIRYTTDGSNPSTSGSVYSAPFPVPNDARIILAIAKAGDVTSDVAKFDVPEGTIAGVVVDPKKPAIWRRKLKKDSTGETFDLLDLLGRYGAHPGGIRLTGLKSPHFWEITTDESSFKEPAEIATLATSMIDLFPGRNVTIDVGTLQFARGQDLLDLVAALKTELKDGEVRQDV